MSDSRRPAELGMKLHTKSANLDSVELAQAALWESADRFLQPADHVCRVLCLLPVPTKRRDRRSAAPQ